MATRITYKARKELWKNSTFGQAVRSLLSLENDSGAWLWFEDACEHIDNFENVTAGQVARAMLVHKLAQFEKQGIGN